MKAVYVDAPESIKVKEVEVPALKENEVLIKVRAAGICGSDIHTYKGLHPFRKPPVIIGHEIAGEVVEVGSSVSDFSAGDRVTVEPQIGTGESEGVMTGNINYSDERLAPGIGEWLGAMAEYFVSPESQVIKLPDSIDYDRGVLVEPLAVGVHAAYKADIKPTDRVAIIGSGPIGLLTLAAVKHRGVETTLVTDVLDYSLDVAEEMGATLTVNSARDANWIENAKNELGGSFDKVFVTAGVRGIIDQSLSLLRKGGKVITVAMFNGSQEVNIENLQQNEKEIIGCMTYNRPDTDEAVRIIEEDKIPVNKVISHKLTLDEADYGFRIVDKKEDESVKVLVKFDS